MLSLSKFSAVKIMALTVSLAACSDGVGLNDTPFDPTASAADLQVVQGAFAANVFESLALSNLVPDTAASPVPLLQASLAAASSGTRWEAQAAAQQLRAYSLAGAAAGSLIPLDLLGRVYDRDPVLGYRHDALRTDGPANGVRFILYEIDPITRTPGTTEIGYVDLLDESTDLAYVIRVLAVTGGVERINYTVSAVVAIQALAFTVSGFISDGTDQINIDLSMSFTEAFPVSTATVSHLISVASRGFEVDATAVFQFNSETFQGSIDVDASFMQGAHTVTLVGAITFSEGDFPSEGGTFEISVDGQLFATVTVDGDLVTVQNATGGDLTAAEAQAVHSIFDGVESIFDDRFEDFIRPVSWLFDAGAAA